MLGCSIDPHIHSVLSPCGDLEMSLRNIVACANNRGVDMIAIADHMFSNRIWDSRFCKVFRQCKY